MEQVVAVLGEDRLGVELDAAVVRPGQTTWMSPVSGSASTRTPSGQRRVRRQPGRRRCCRSRPARSRPSIVHRRLGALEDDVLVGQRDPELVAQRLVAQAHREERPPGRQQRGDRRAAACAIFGSSSSRGSPGPGPTIDQVEAVEAARRRTRRGAPPSLVMPSTPSTWRSMFTKSSSPSRITTLLPASRGSGRRAGLVGQPERRQPPVARVEGEQHVLVADQLGDVRRSGSAPAAPARTR